MFKSLFLVYFRSKDSVHFSKLGSQSAQILGENDDNLRSKLITIGLSMHWATGILDLGSEVEVTRSNVSFKVCAFSTFGETCGYCQSILVCSFML